jgi:hypothetical protein
MPLEIKIALSDGQVRPENDPPHTVDNRRTTVPRGESIVFTFPAGYWAASITFDNESPFGASPQDKVIGYGDARTIPPEAPTGIFSYTCEITGPDGVRHSSGGGGEIEVGR